MTYSTCKYSYSSTWATNAANVGTSSVRSPRRTLAWKSYFGLSPVPVQKRRPFSCLKVTLSVTESLDIDQASEKYGWNTNLKQRDWKDDPQVQELPVKAIRRPLQGSRSNGMHI